MRKDGTDRDSKTKTWVFRLIACGIPCIVGAIAIVCVLFDQERLTYDPQQRRVRLQFPPIYLQEVGHERTGHRYIYDATLGWRNIPNWQATTLGRPLTINSKGLRDREYSYEKPARVRRILVLGDSYAWGYGVADKEVFTEVLEEQLHDGSGTWEVLNTGVSGWGTDQQYLFLRDEGMKYCPTS